MAAVEVTISGVLYDKTARTTQPVVLIGEASLTGLGVGGGPIIPPGQPPGPVDPGYGKPTPPEMIWGGRPGPGDGGSWVPPQGEKPPDPTTPPVSWKTIWTPTEGWVAVGVINPDLPHPTPSA